MDSVSTEYSKDIRDGDHRQSSKFVTDVFEDSGKFNWPGAEEEKEKEEILRTDCRRKSEEEDWDWKREET
ncbi:nose resistant to fluoxetine protein 6 [Lasius niger]|uniref:Nose resistant to fluoxetine protein 6 n=1 Tax=Lasius niger TaxID=67767 RepID=A0A0J7KPK2_LASNI|nr:nose resistant to fluoxetine protein 6 [Lasius niger]